MIEIILEDWEKLIDSSIEKSKRDLSKLIPVKKQVVRNGKTYLTTVYESPEEEKEVKKPNKNFEVDSNFFARNPSETNLILRPIRKTLGVSGYKEFLRAHGIEWSPGATSEMADTMRASQKAKEYLLKGNTLDLGLYEHMRKGGKVSDYKGQKEPTPAKTNEVVEDKKTKEKEKKTETTRDKIKNAKKTKELEDIVKNTFNVKHVSFNGMDLDESKGICLELERFLKKFPGIQEDKRLNVFGLIGGVKKDISKETGKEFGEKQKEVIDKSINLRENSAAAYFSTRFPILHHVIGGIYFNEKFFLKKNETFSKEKLSEMGRKKWGIATDLRKTAVHEIGHVVHNIYENRDFLNPATKININKKFEDIANKYTPQQIEDGLSKYARVNLDNSIHEFVAEAFAEYYTSENPRPIAKEVGGLFEELATIKGRGY